jgi:hypothetical protein
MRPAVAAQRGADHARILVRMNPSRCEAPGAVGAPP